MESGWKKPCVLSCSGSKQKC